MIPNEEIRPMDARADAYPQEYVTGHCHDAEKCNSETFCNCVCRTCMGTKRGEYQHR